MCRGFGCAAGKLLVTLNGVDVSAPSLDAYVNMYRSSEDHPILFQDINSRWSVGVGLSETGFGSVSFVNGMSTNRGGNVQHCFRTSNRGMVT